MWIINSHNTPRSFGWHKLKQTSNLCNQLARTEERKWWIFGYPKPIIWTIIFKIARNKTDSFHEIRCVILKMIYSVDSSFWNNLTSRNWLICKLLLSWFLKHDWDRVTGIPEEEFLLSFVIEYNANEEEGNVKNSFDKLKTTNIRTWIVRSLHEIYTFTPVNIETM